MESVVWAVTVVLAALVGVQGLIPDYIHVCKRNDPKIDECIINSIEELRPHLIQGIPELEVPPMEPLIIPEVVISPGAGFKAFGTDITVRGASNFEILSLKSDIANDKFLVKIRIPFMSFDANYDVNAKILALNIKGKGPIHANTTDVEGTAIIKGHKEKFQGKTVLRIDSLDLKLKMKNYNVHVENLFNGDQPLSDVVNAALNENKKEILQVMRPRAEETVSNLLLSIANKITTHFEYDELFPDS